MRRVAGTPQPFRLPACPCRRAAPQPSSISTSSRPSMSTQTLAWMRRWPRPHPVVQVRTALSARVLMGSWYPMGLLRHRQLPGTAQSWHSRLPLRPAGSQRPRALPRWALQLQPTLALPLDGRLHGCQRPASPALAQTPSSSPAWSLWRPPTLKVMRPSGPPLQPGMRAAALPALREHPACDFRESASTRTCARLCGSGMCIIRDDRH